jgi:hypothetical protein
MGMLDMVINILTNFKDFVVFLYCLARGRRHAWVLLYKVMARPTREEALRCSASKRSMKNKYRPKRIMNNDGTGRLAEAGELGGMLYGVESTHVSDMKEFGIGISTFFLIEHGYAILLTLGFFVVIPSISYFGRSAYSNSQPGTVFYLKGSGVCTDRSEVTVWHPISGQNITEIKTHCNLTKLQAYLNMSAISFFAVAMVFFWRYVTKQIEVIDEGAQTAQDYSIIVQDPDADAHNPDEWEQFFSQFGEVASVTVALGNGQLLTELANQRLHNMSVAMRAKFRMDQQRLKKLERQRQQERHGTRHKAKTSTSESHHRSAKSMIAKLADVVADRPTPSSTTQIDSIETHQRTAAEAIFDECHKDVHMSKTKGAIHGMDLADQGKKNADPSLEEEVVIRPVLMQMQRMSTQRFFLGLAQEDSLTGRWLAQESLVSTKNLRAIFNLLSGFRRAGKKKANVGKALTKKVDELLDQSFPVTKVFVIFEDEAGQRNCLRQLSNGLIASMLDRADNLPEHLKFRGTNVLSVIEAPEPTEIVWERLDHVSTSWKIVTNLTSYVLIFGAVYAAVQCIGRVSQMDSEYSIYYTAMTISTAQALIPGLIDIAVNEEKVMFRSHIELSKMNKTYFFEVMTSAFAIYMFSNFEDTLTEKFLDQMQQVLIFDSCVAPIIRWLQPFVYFERWVLAPITESQMLRENYFRGQATCVGVEFAHRMATLFLGFFGAAVLPIGLGMTSIAFIGAYWQCKHGIFRRWLRIANFGPGLLSTACLHTFLAIWGSFAMSAHFYSGWPFDNLCSIDADPKNGYYLCDKRPTEWFFVQPKVWQSPEQQEIVKSYGYVTVLVGLALFAWWMSVSVLYTVRLLFWGDNRPVGADQGVPYTTVDEIQAYVPFMPHELLETPLIACDRELFDDEYIHFQADYDLYDVYAETKIKLQNMKKDHSRVRMSRIFSTCKAYPTRANPDPLNKIDAGDRGSGSLFVTLEGYRNIQTVHRKLQARMTYMGARWKTSSRIQGHSFGETFRVQMEDLQCPLVVLLEFHKRGSHWSDKVLKLFGKQPASREVGRASIDLQDIINNRANDEWWSQDLPLESDHASDTLVFMRHKGSDGLQGRLQLKFHYCAAEVSAGDGDGARRTGWGKVASLHATASSIVIATKALCRLKSAREVLAKAALPTKPQECHGDAPSSANTVSDPRGGRYTHAFTAGEGGSRGGVGRSWEPSYYATDDARAIHLATLDEAQKERERKSKQDVPRTTSLASVPGWLSTPLPCRTLSSNIQEKETQVAVASVLSARSLSPAVRPRATIDPAVIQDNHSERPGSPGQTFRIATAESATMTASMKSTSCPHVFYDGRSLETTDGAGGARIMV